MGAPFTFCVPSRAYGYLLSLMSRVCCYARMVELQETYLVIYVNAISAPSEEFAVI